MAASDAALIGAVITASVAVVVAIVTQVWTSQRSRIDRQYVSRRAGLAEAQDAMLDLREALAEYGRGIRASQDQPELEAAKRTATGRFETRVARVHDDAVATAMSTWRSAAERSLISVEDLSAHVEDEWFAYVQDLCRAALMSSTGVTTQRDRAGVTVPAALVGD
ncbi:hypothetical protein SAMN05443575_1451 [Jatrophihabitans endophyticus]|uniref:LemA protein n=1 Tax=Jatrophihabitans endophyticus TaxID=1206085 RepID=A0A1M5HAQ7_9ACTN|nr:hypothetical protein [Jatrophihabitans endophyticus]SHG12958.1 hypothetical protein SAMN05443575_1451 [Jatrophihabitans endophyticus]